MKIEIIHFSVERDDSYYQDIQRRQLADLALKGAQKLGGSLGRMCSTCAFKLDSDANLEPHNVDAAADCLASGGTFNCHVESGVDKGCVCVGFQYAQAYFDCL